MSYDVCSSEEEREEKGLLFVILALIMLKEGSMQEGEPPSPTPPAPLVVFPNCYTQSKCHLWLAMPPTYVMVYVMVVEHS